MIHREFSSNHINAILNDPSVRQSVADEGNKPLDISAAVSNQQNILLMGEFGGCMFFYLQPGVYEVHTQVLRHARGRWTRALTQACAEWMFTRTPAYEIVTRVPKLHIPARAAALAQGMRYEFTRPMECRFHGTVMDVDIHSFRIQDWAPTAPGMEAIGERFHDQLHAEADRLGIHAPAHADDPNHNQYVGICLAMARAGQVHKAVDFYNRWAVVSRHATISCVSVSPIVVQFDIGRLLLRGDDIEVLP